MAAIRNRVPNVGPFAPDPTPPVIPAGPNSILIFPQDSPGNLIQGAGAPVWQRVPFPTPGQQVEGSTLVLGPVDGEIRKAVAGGGTHVQGAVSVALSGPAEGTLVNFELAIGLNGAIPTSAFYTKGIVAGLMVGPDDPNPIMHVTASYQDFLSLNDVVALYARMSAVGDPQLIATIAGARLNAFRVAQ